MAIALNYKYFIMLYHCWSVSVIIIFVIVVVIVIITVVVVATLVDLIYMIFKTNVIYW